MGNKNVCYSGYLWCVCLCNTHLQKKNLNGILLFLGISSTLLYLLNHVFLVSDSKNIINALRFTSMFFIGASAFILKDKIILSYRIAILICFVVLVVHVDVLYILTCMVCILQILSHRRRTFLYHL